MTILARRYDTGDLIKLELAGDRIASVCAVGPPDGSAKFPWVAPGFVDIQVNGYDGQEFSSLDLTPQKAADIVRRHYAFGVTGLCPTLTTQSAEVFLHAVRAIAQACEEWPEIARRVLGIHLEGPFISAEEGARGAHPAAHCRRPDWELFCRFQEAAGGRVKILTMSVEFDEAPDFIAKVVASGVVVAIGHTGANSAQIKAAVDSGARLSTHLGNGAHRMLRRHPNYIWDQLAEDRLYASLIVDGHHLPGEVVKCFVRGKTPQRCILVSDESGLAGLPPGRYTSSGCELEILPDGRLVIAGQDQLLAGASRPIGAGVVNVMKFAGVDLAMAVNMATQHPCQLLGLHVPNLYPSDRADLVLFDLEDGELNVRAAIADGQLVYGNV